MKVKVSKRPKIPFSLFALTAKNFLWSAWSRSDFPKPYRIQESEAGDGDTLREAAQRRGLWIGAAVNDIAGPLGQLLPRHFNSVTAENAMKWGELRRSLAEPYDFRKADAIVDFAVAHGMRMRGHALVWGKFPGSGFPGDLPDRLNCAGNPKAELHRILEEHIGTTMEHFKGRVGTWDVVNEPYELFSRGVDKNAFVQAMGMDYLPLAFQLARETDPGAKLFLNEHVYNYSDRKADNLLKLVRTLRDGNVPVDGVGLQSHILFELPSMKDLRTYMKCLAELGLEIEITELDATIGLFRKAADPYQAQAEFFREFIGTCLESPACRGITFWGVSDRDNWMDSLPPLIPFKPNSPLLFDVDLIPKPAYKEVLASLNS